MLATADGYRATRKDGILTVHDVPIFLEHFRSQDGKDVTFDGHYSREWLNAAAAFARQQQRGRYDPPLNIRHHNFRDAEENSRVQNVGTFRIKEVRTITYKDKPKAALVADLTFKKEWAQAAAMRGEYPYLSVEIFNVDEKPQINALSLLDDMEPFFQLPNLEIGHVEDLGGRVSDDTTPVGWSMQSAEVGGPMVACYSAGVSRALLFKREPLMSKTKDKKPDDFGTGVTTPPIQFTATYEGSGDDEKDKDKDEKAEGDTDEKKEEKSEGGGESFDLKGLLKAIKDGSISVSDRDAILQALDAASGAEAPPEQQPAPATLPGADSMSANPSPEQTGQYAALAAEHTVLKGKVEQMEAAGTRVTEVAAAFRLLEDRGLGGNLKKDLETYHAEHGSAAFQSYVAAIEKHAAPIEHDNIPVMGGATNPSVSSAVMAYQELGPDAVKQAAIYADCYQSNAERGQVGKMTEADYIAINMENHGVTLNTAG